MIFWISLIIVIAACGVLGFVLFRHWKEIRLLDTDTIRAEQDKNARNRIMRERFERQFKRWMAPIRHAGKGTINKLGESIASMEHRLRQATGMEHLDKGDGRRATGAAGGERVIQLIREAQALAKEGKTSRAEHAYLEALKIDMRNVEAYRGLGALFLSERQYKQAKETFDFLVHLKSADGAVYAGLAMIAEAEMNYQDAETHRKKAIELEPTMIRHCELGEYYLRRERGTDAIEQAKLARAIDSEAVRPLELMADAALMLKDRKEAELAYQTLRIKGCERSILQRLKEQLDALETDEE